MRKSCYFYALLVFATACICSCVESDTGRSGPSDMQDQLSVDEARAFFENMTLPHMTRSGADEVSQGVFALDHVIPDWSRAELSSYLHLASVDIPVAIHCEFYILRRRADNSAYEVRADGKLLVVKSSETGSLATYMRFVVPDEMYAMCYEGDLSDLYKNCERREDYCGIELYTTMDGAIAAVARYVEGELAAEIFMGDRTLSPGEKTYRLQQLMRGIYIRRTILSDTRASGDWDFGGKSCFYDSKGTLYFVDKINGQEYVTIDFDGTRTCNSDGTTSSGGGFGGGGSNSGIGDGFSGQGGSGNGSGGDPGCGPGGGPGGSTGGGTGGTGTDTGTGDGPDNSGPTLPAIDINPIPWEHPILPQGVLRNPFLKTDDSDLLDKLDSLQKDCMGKKLISSFYRPLQIRTVPGRGANFNSGTGTISVGEDAPWFALLEELIHAYQNQNIPAGENDHMLNDEIEAKFGWVLFLKRHGVEIEDYKRSLGWQKGVDAFDELYEIYDMGFLFSPDSNNYWYKDAYYILVDIFRNPESPYNSPIKYPFSDRHVNFDNLTELISDC